VRLHTIIRTIAVAALVAVPSIAMAAPDQNSCPNGQWVNGQCVYNNNGQWNNGRWNNNGQNNRDRDRRDRDDRNRGYNNNGYNNGAYNNGYGYGGGNGQMSGTVSSFSPYNLYLNNGMHVELHNGTVINPTGTNLAAGQRVRVIGNWNSDGTFNANEVDVVGNRGYRY
jgi:hypothetical protein